MSAKCRAVRDVALANLVIWLVVVLPLTIGVAMTSDYESEQWGVVRSVQSVLVNRYLTDWNNPEKPERGHGPVPDPGDPGVGDTGSED